MLKIQINASRHGTPGEVIAVEDGQVVWAGPIEALREAGSFDALFCHDDDEGLLVRLTSAVESGGGAGVRLRKSS